MDGRRGGGRRRLARGRAARGEVALGRRGGAEGVDRLLEGRGRSAGEVGHEGQRAALAVASHRVLQHAPKLAHVARAHGGVEAERAREHGLDRVAHEQPERARRGAAVRVERAHAHLDGRIARHRRPVGGELEHHEREREHVGVRRDGAEGVVDLLGRAVAGGEGAHAADRRAAGAREHVVAHDLRDAEVEQLQARRAPCARDEEVRRVQIAVDDALRVRERDGLGDRVEQPHDVGQRTPALAALAPGAKLLGEGVPLEPLEHHVGHARSRRGRGERPGGDGARDVQAPRRESVVDAALVVEAQLERGRDRGVEPRLQLEALDRDRLVEPDVVRVVDDAEAPLAHDAIDAELPIEHLADEPERVTRHRPSLHHPSPSPPEPARRAAQRP